MLYLFKSVFLVFVLCFALSCGFKNDKTQPAPVASGGVQEDVQVPPSDCVMGYNSIKKVIFEPHCIGCHGEVDSTGKKHVKGDVDLTTYSLAAAKLDKIYHEVVVEKSMPPAKAKGPLGPNAQAIIREWKLMKAPENDINIPDPESSPEPSPSASE